MINLTTWGGLPVEIRHQMIDKALNSHAWPEGFPETIRDNLHVLEAVIRETKRLRALGRGHYSMRTIIEFIRHNTAVSQAASDWKINNNVQAPLTRLVMILFPELCGFFHTRERRNGRLGVAA